MKIGFRFRKLCALLCAGGLAVTFSAACGQAGEAERTTHQADGSAAGQAGASPAALEDPVRGEEMFTERDGEPSYDEERSTLVVLEGGTVTISEEGTYVLRGSLADGMVIVDAADTAKVQLVLDGVAISNSRGAAIYVREADKVFLTLAEGSVNTLSNGGSYVAIDENNVDGVIFARSDLTINGSGSLNVSAAEGHGIVSKDDLKVTGGEISVTAARHGLSGKDSVRVAAGNLLLTAGKDGIHAENADDGTKGFVYIAGGSLEVRSEGDCVSAGAFLQVDGGSFRLTAGKGSAEKTAAVDENGETVSTKGIKAGGQLAVNGGAFQIDAQDDALHADDCLAVKGGTFELASGDDGIHSDGMIVIMAGSLEILTSQEGIEGKAVVVSGGSIRLYARDDGVNAAGGRDGSGYQGAFGGGFPGGDISEGGFPGGDMMGGEIPEGDIPRGGIPGGDVPEEGFPGGDVPGGEIPGGDIPRGGFPDGDIPEEGFSGGRPGREGQDRDESRRGGMMERPDSDCYILITGGELWINADGDGLDSNGDLTVTGGAVYVSGPENGANGALDYSGDAQITGGTVIAAGNERMAENFGDASTQGSILLNTSDCQAGSKVSVKDGEGNVLAEYVPEKSFNSLVVSAPGMTAGQMYTVTAGTEAYEVAMESVIHGTGGAGFQKTPRRAGGF